MRGLPLGAFVLFAATATASLTCPKADPSAASRTVAGTSAQILVFSNLEIM